ncbi:hypothetical protein PO909_014976 [Leuciscus waleckii]
MLNLIYKHIYCSPIFVDVPCERADVTFSSLSSKLSFPAKQQDRCNDPLPAWEMDSLSFLGFLQKLRSRRKRAVQSSTATPESVKPTAIFSQASSNSQEYSPTESARSVSVTAESTKVTAILPGLAELAVDTTEAAQHTVSARQKRKKRKASAEQSTILHSQTPGPVVPEAIPKLPVVIVEKAFSEFLANLVKSLEIISAKPVVTTECEAAVKLPEPAAVSVAPAPESTVPVHASAAQEGVLESVPVHASAAQEGAPESVPVPDSKTFTNPASSVFVPKSVKPSWKSRSVRPVPVSNSASNQVPIPPIPPYVFPGYGSPKPAPPWSALNFLAGSAPTRPRLEASIRGVLPWQLCLCCLVFMSLCLCYA